jgi:hypothetical protein
VLHSPTEGSARSRPTPCGTCDAQRAIRIVREFGVLPDKIGVMGCRSGMARLAFGCLEGWTNN